MRQLPHIRLSKKLKALQDPTRLKILSLLAKKPLCVCVIVEALKLAQPTISRHLGLLENSGFIEKERKGRMIIYALAPEDELTERLLHLSLAEMEKDPECVSLRAKVREADMALASHLGDPSGISLSCEEGRR